MRARRPASSTTSSPASKESTPRRSIRSRPGRERLAILVRALTEASLPELPVTRRHTRPYIVTSIKAFAARRRSDADGAGKPSRGAGKRPLSTPGSAPQCSPGCPWFPATTVFDASRVSAISLRIPAVGESTQALPDACRTRHLTPHRVYGTRCALPRPTVAHLTALEENACCR